MNKEVWKEIVEAPDYEVSNFGEIRSKKYGDKRIIKQSIKKTGYKEVGLCYKPNKRRWFLVHRLVLTAFNPIENMDIMEVNHKDENKQNNNLENLEWATSKENCNYGSRNIKCGQAKAKKVRCVETGIIYDSGKEASEHTNATRSGISNCLNGKKNKSGGFHWEAVI